MAQTKSIPFLWYAKHGGAARLDSISELSHRGRHGAAERVAERTARLREGGGILALRAAVQGHERRPAPRVQRCHLDGGALLDDQAELDCYWNALLEGGGKPQACGSLVDRYGVRWQINPASLEPMMRDKDLARAKRVSDAMLRMVKLDIAALEKAYRGG